MTEKKEAARKEKKGFFARIVEKLDKMLEEKSKSKPCCGSDKDKGSCC